MEQDKFLTTTREEMLAQVDKLEECLFELEERISSLGCRFYPDYLTDMSEEEKKLTEKQWEKWDELGIDFYDTPFAISDMCYELENAIYVLIGTLEKFTGRLKDGDN